ncbi:unnamed protein product [Durusdinium trenchii]|uniref:Uncharacterized protein n=1 Tax=Durusdinium trenchii TaxID=1381693 RepID=A0ABP0STE6_9DINO
MAFASGSKSSSGHLTVQGANPKLQLWPGETWVEQPSTDQLADFIGMLTSIRRPKPMMMRQESWRKLLMVLLVRLKVKRRRCRTLQEVFPGHMLILVWKVLQKALPVAEGDNLANMLTEEVIVKRIANLQDHVERVCAVIQITESGDVRYPSHFPERLNRAYIQYAFECANPLSQAVRTK